MSAHWGLLTHEAIHFGLTALIAGFLFWRYKDWRLAGVAFLVGIFIDLDHWFDYFLYFGPSLNWAQFFDVGSYVTASGKVYVPFHGWELTVPFWLISRAIGKGRRIMGLEWAILLSYLGHLLWDNFSFSHHPLAYFLIYRWLTGFSLESFDGA